MNWGTFARTSVEFLIESMATFINEYRRVLSDIINANDHEELNHAVHSCKKTGKDLGLKCGSNCSKIYKNVEFYFSNNPYSGKFSGSSDDKIQFTEEVLAHAVSVERDHCNPERFSEERAVPLCMCQSLFPCIATEMEWNSNTLINNRLKPVNLSCLEESMKELLDEL